jgi:uncharacterized protein (DUF342 family)
MDLLNNPGNGEHDETGTDLNRSTVVPAGQNDGSITITFLNSDLEARGDFMPPIGRGAPINLDYIRDLLEKLNIVYGIQWESIQDAVQECNLGRKILRNILIAQGDPPVSEIAEYMQINPYLGQSGKAKEDGKIDYRSQSPFIIVKKDQALAKQKSRKIGRDGKNVHGAVIPHGTLRPAGVSGGKNTRMEGRYLLSNINGQFVETGGVVSVSDSLVIKGGVGYKTGNIIFPGDVVIDGPVSDGFKIYSGGSVTIKQTFDVTDAVTRNDLTVAGGLIGRGRALVKVGGSMRSKFIENCLVAARKTIFVDLEIINSNVFTLENLEMSDRGRILGGEIWAVRGLRTGAIGKKTGKPTRIHCGIDFTIEQEKEKNNNMLRILAAKLARLRELLADPSAEGEKKAKLEQLRLRLEEEERKASSKAAELMGRLNTDENAAVEVSGEIAEKTLIEICQVALFVTSPLKKVRIRLDKGNGKLVTENL